MSTTPSARVPTVNPGPARRDAMHPCCPTKAELRAFHAGELPVARLDEVADHLEGCPDCNRTVQSFDDLSDPVVAVLRQPGPSGRSSTAVPGARSQSDDDRFELGPARERIGQYEIL